MTRATLLLVTLAAGCGAPTTRASVVHLPARGGCEELTYCKEALTFRCGAVTYDLLQTPVRSRRIFDILSREAVTTRHYLVRAGKRYYAFRTEQLEGARFPREVLLETRRGFAHVQLGDDGEVIATEQTPGLTAGR